MPKTSQKPISRATRQRCMTSGDAHLLEVGQDHVPFGSDELLKYGLLAPQTGCVLVLLKAVLVAQVVHPQLLLPSACCIHLK